MLPLVLPERQKRKRCDRGGVAVEGIMIPRTLYDCGGADVD
jgi:hypothetical protein